LWLVVYIRTILGLLRNKELEIPYYAVVLNFGCEVTTAFFFVPDMGLALVIAYWAWMILDIFIVVGLFKYAHKQFNIPFFRKYLIPFTIFWLPLTYVIQKYFIVNYDLPMAPLDSFVINLVMSICFVYLLFSTGKSSNSTIIAWCKFLGTGIIGIMFFTKYPYHNMLTALYIGCAFFDIVYIYLIYNPQVVNKYRYNHNMDQ
jgi:hypothetical protein